VVPAGSWAATLPIVDAVTQAVEPFRPLTASPAPHPPRRHARRRALAGFAVLVLLLHAMLIGGADWAATAASPDPQTGVPMLVRTIASGPVPTEALPQAPPPAPEPALPAATRLAPPPIATAPKSALRSGVGAEAGARTADAPGAAASDRPSSDSQPRADAAAADRPAAPVETATPAAPAGSGPASFLAAGQAPPPVYRTRLSPPVTLRYEVQSGLFRGTGEIRWRPAGEAYELRLDARIGGLTLLSQSSQGAIDGAGLAPLRFVDRRARRSAQAANFDRAAATISFSGPSTRWALLAGTQDQLSWMIQLAAIVAAGPDHAAEGGQVSMVVVSARGDADVRTFRYAGREDVATAAGRVRAVKFVQDSRSAHDRSNEIWLDPERNYLPAHATQRNGAGESEFDLLLQAVEPGS
jgi:hypothetical protein